MDLRVQGVSKSFVGVKALVNVDFEAKFGEVHALLGENGAGKSTFIKILAGSLRPDEGTIYLDEKPIVIKNPSDAVKAGICTIYQELSLIPNLSVAHNIFLNRDDIVKNGMVNDKQINQMTKELLEKYEVTQIKPTDKVRDLGLPYQQMVEIVKTLAKDPKVIIMDEATSALTDDRVQWLLDVTRKKVEEGCLVVFISHRMSEIMTGCDRVTVFRGGENVGTRVLSETTPDELVTMMLGRKMSGYFPEKVTHKTDEVLLETIALSYGRKLLPTDLKIHAGEVVGVGGLAGQGQSILFKLLAGVFAGEGDIIVNGEKLAPKSPHDCIEKSIALIPEERGAQGLVLQLQIDENISLSIIDKLKKAIFIDKKKQNAIVKESMERFSIKAESGETLVMTLSGGNQQKVVFAKIMVTHPQVVLLYDCTRGVDVGTKMEIFKLVRSLAQEGRGLLYYSSDLEELVNICDRVCVMHDGEMVAALEGGNLTKEGILKASVGMVEDNGQITA